MQITKLFLALSAASAAAASFASVTPVVSVVSVALVSSIAPAAAAPVVPAASPALAKRSFRDFWNINFKNAPKKNGKCFWGGNSCRYSDHKERPEDDKRKRSALPESPLHDGMCAS